MKTLNSLIIFILSILISSCCGERIVEYDKIDILITEDENIASIDTLTANNNLTLLYSTRTIEECNCTACFKENFKNKILDDSIKMYFNTPFVIGSNTINASTELFSNKETAKLLNIETSNNLHSRVININSELINSLSKDSVTITIESLTDDNQKLIASKTVYINN